MIRTLKRIIHCGISVYLTMRVQIKKELTRIRIDI